jgi:hypothetical protein
MFVDFSSIEGLRIIKIGDGDGLNCKFRLSLYPFYALDNCQVAD